MACKNKCGCQSSGTDDSKSTAPIDDVSDFESPSELENRIQNLNPHVDPYRFKTEAESVSSVINDYFSE